MKDLFSKAGRVVIYIAIILSLVAPWLIAAPFFKLFGI